MAKPAADTCKLQVTIDAVTDRLIGEIASLKFQGTNKSEVTCTIIRKWLWDNQDQLRQNGVYINPSADKKS